jgi:hypothetical protein
MRNRPGAALALYHLAIKLLQDEGEGACRLESIYDDAFLICAFHRDMARAKAFMRRAIEARKAWKGHDAAGLRDMILLELVPQTHETACTTKRWVTDITEHDSFESAAVDEEWLWQRALPITAPEVKQFLVPANDQRADADEERLEAFPRMTMAEAFLRMKFEQAARESDGRCVVA